MTILSIRYERHAQRRDTEANWAAANPVLAAGEIGAVTDSGLPWPTKIGDGSTAWLSLPYSGDLFAAASGTNTITATFDPVPVLYDGMEVRLRAAGANTGAVTFNPNSLGAAAVTRDGGTALTGGEIAGAGHELRLRYRSSVPRWELLNPFRQVPIQFKDEGSNIGSPGAISSVDFVGTGVSAAVVGNALTVTINSSTGGGLYLDSYTTQPRAVLSLRKLISTATVAIRVRRSSDNTESDIGFVGNALDTATLLTFCGAGSGYVTKFYDQTGNGEDAEQATTTKQPRIVNAGAYDGKLVFDGTDDFLKITSLTLGTPYYGLYAKFDQPSFSTEKMIIEHGLVYNTSGGCRWNATAGGAFKVAPYGTNTGSGTDYRSLESTGRTGFLVRSIVLDRSIVGAGEITMWQGGLSMGATATDGTTEQTGNFSSLDVYIGAKAAGTASFNNFQVETMVFYNADTPALRPAIEALIA